MYNCSSSLSLSSLSLSLSSTAKDATNSNIINSSSKYQQFKTNLKKSSSLTSSPSPSPAYRHRHSFIHTEHPKDSSRWERGSSGLNVAFQSQSFTRSLYSGLLRITPLSCSDLPDDDSTSESLLTGSGVDAYLLVAVAEGRSTADVTQIETDRYSGGVTALAGCAHVGRSTTAWSNVQEGKKG